MLDVNGHLCYICHIKSVQSDPEAMMERNISHIFGQRFWRSLITSSRTILRQKRAKRLNVCCVKEIQKMRQKCSLQVV